METERTIEIIHVITEPTRFHILKMLFQHHYCVRVLSKKLGVSESAVSQHMNILKKYGIVHGKKIGYQTHYLINQQLLLEIADDFRSQLTKHQAFDTVSVNCSCEYLSECIRRDSKNKGDQNHG